MIQDILDFSRIETGKLSIINTEFDLFRLLKDVESITRINAQKKMLSFDIIKPERNLKLIGDPNRILQIFNNLISNAIKFTEKGGIRVEVDIKYLEDDTVVFDAVIEDTGCGIPSDKLQSLFRPWAQTTEGAMKSMSSGLGLYICKSLITYMSGKIGIDNTKKGTRVEFSVPLNIATDKRPRKESTPEIIRKTKKSEKMENLYKNHRLLIAEDNKVNQKILCRFLKKMNLKYDVANDGQEAVDFYLKNPTKHYSLILLDQSMPKLSGDIVSQKIKEIDSTQTIISISANAFINNNVDDCKKLIDSYISKPFTFEKFSETIYSLLEN